MNTTETDRLASHVPQWLPTIRLLYCGDLGPVTGPPRLLHGTLAIGRDVPDREGIGLPHDRRASRVHATLHASADGQTVRIKDAGSKNGTFLNGRQVDEAGLGDSDLIQVGSSFLLVRNEPTTPADAPSDTLLGVSPAIRSVRATLHRIAPSPVSVLLLGESGTGKEVAAHALYHGSGRRGLFVAVNCASIPEGLAESHLFGHAAGAFTGARAAQPGFFRQAEGGTLLLDEIGELPPALQPKLLRALEQGEVVPVGTTAPVPCNVRVVAATNRDLLQAVAAGAFRGDLYARLSGTIVSLPPLRERREDILPLLLHALGQPALALPADLTNDLLLHPWPYNVRELKKCAERLRLHGVSAPLGVLLAGAGASGQAQTGPSKKGEMPSRNELAKLMEAHRGVIADVARAVGRSRRQVDRWLDHYRLDRSVFRR